MGKGGYYRSQGLRGEVGRKRLNVEMVRAKERSVRYTNASFSNKDPRVRKKCREKFAEIGVQDDGSTFDILDFPPEYYLSIPIITQ
jgi:hypothetical protein